VSAITYTTELLSRGGLRCLRVLHRLLLARLGCGQPVSTAVWERQYRDGYWDFLQSPLEIDHYLAIIAFARDAGTGLRILDVGCGSGRLLQLLDPAVFTRYVGIDVSHAAIAAARALNVPNAHFHACNFNRWTSDEAFDLIVFNESLSYALRPVYQAKRYARWLAPGGAIIASLADYGNHETIWRRLEKDFLARAARIVVNDKKQRWTVKALVPRRPEETS
jgi:SAM-dependent methyltransferase